MKRTKKHLQKLINDFTKGVGITQNSFEAFRNDNGDKMPCSWVIAWKIMKIDSYCPSLHKSQVLLNFFNEDYYIKDGIIRLGTEPVKDANNDNN